MATANNTIKTRIQLKSDTEANWNKAGPKENSPGFVPLAGELIIYMPDATHDYSRLKVGNGQTNVTLLPFIDAGTINGETLVNEIVTISGTLPPVGDSTKLYVDTTNSRLYYYNGTSYQRLSNFTYTVTKSTASNISQWSEGRQPVFTVTGSTFSVSSGANPSLTYLNSNYVTDVTRDGGT